MNTAARIIERFGGVPKLARILDRPTRTVQSWKEVGRIPAQHQQAVLDAAKLAAIPLVPADFFNGADDTASIGS